MFVPGYNNLVRAACCNGTKCPLLTAFFSLSATLFFLPEGVASAPSLQNDLDSDQPYSIFGQTSNI